MALAIRTIEIYSTAENLSAREGPLVTHYAITLDAPHLLRRWVPGDASYADGYYVLSHVGANSGRWVPVGADDRGVDLPNSDATVYVSGKRTRYLVASTLTDNRVLTVSSYTASDSNAAVVPSGAELSIVRLDVEAYSFEIVSQVLPSGPNESLITLPPGKAWFVDLRFQDTQWLLRRAGSMTP